MCISWNKENNRNNTHGATIKKEFIGLYAMEGQRTGAVFVHFKVMFK
jgi:hypothetical protein